MEATMSDRDQSGPETAQTRTLNCQDGEEVARERSGGAEGSGTSTAPDAFGEAMIAAADAVDAYVAASGAPDVKPPAALIIGLAVRAAAPIIAAQAEEQWQTWDGLLAWLDRRYPVNVFPVEPDHVARDKGARILSLVRRVAKAEQELAEATTALTELAPSSMQTENADLRARLATAGRDALRQAAEDLPRTGWRLAAYAWLRERAEAVSSDADPA